MAMQVTRDWANYRAHFCPSSTCMKLCGVCNLNPSTSTVSHQYWVWHEEGLDCFDVKIDRQYRGWNEGVRTRTVLYLAGCFNVLLTSHEHQNITGRESKMDGKHLILIGNDEKRKG